MDRMNVTIDIRSGSVGARRVNLRSSLVVGNLIATIQDKYTLEGVFELHLDNTRQALPETAELEQAGVTEGSVLICSRVIVATGTQEAIARGTRAHLSKNFKRVYLQEDRELIEFDMVWQPAILGRRNQRDPSQNKLLTVDLGDAEEAPSVSRHHAAITEAGGSFFLESLNEHNPTYLGDTRLRYGVKYPLPAGSRIGIGRLALTFHIIS